MKYINSFFKMIFKDLKWYYKLIVVSYIIMDLFLLIVPAIWSLDSNNELWMRITFMILWGIILSTNAVMIVISWWIGYDLYEEKQ